MKALTRLSAVLFLSILFVGCTGGTPEKTSKVVQSAPKATLSSPVAGSLLSSPVTVIGTAPGTWFSEGQIPVELIASDGSSIALVSAKAQGSWMTEKQVPFQAVITFQTTSKYGALVVRKNNPSGLPEHDDSFSIGVSF